MKRQSLRILLAILGFAVLGGTGKAQVLDQITVTVPFQFVIAGKTLPAGTYEGHRVSATGDRFTGLVLKNVDDRVSAIVLPVEVESTRGEAKFSFDQVGDQHFLTRIQTGDNVYNFEVPRRATLLASTPSQTGAVSTSDGSN
jgi:hypothetical protein